MKQSIFFRGLGGTAIALGAILSTTAFFAAPAHAGTKVYLPYVEKGEIEIEYRGSRTVDSDNTKDNKQANKIALGYGVTDFWFTEIYAVWERSPGGTTVYKATEWANYFQLTDRGEYWADFGFLVEYVSAAQSGSADKIEFGPLITKDIGRTTNTANILFENEVGANRSSGTALGYALETRWRLAPRFEPAIQAFGEFGDVDKFNTVDNQSHRIGPVLLGSFSLGSLPGKIGYDVGYLFGVTDGAEDGTVKVNLEYEFRL